MQRLMSTLSFGLLLVLLSGCENAPATDPVAEFKPIVARFIPAITKAYLEGHAAGRSPLGSPTIEFDENSIKFDVKKTDSVVSPLTGVISCDAYFGKMTVITSGTGTFEFVFAYQDAHIRTGNGWLKADDSWKEPATLMEERQGQSQCGAGKLNSPSLSYNRLCRVYDPQSSHRPTTGSTRRGLAWS